MTKKSPSEKLRDALEELGQCEQRLIASNEHILTLQYELQEECERYLIELKSIDESGLSLFKDSNIHIYVTLSLLLARFVENLESVKLDVYRMELSSTVGMDGVYEGEIGSGVHPGMGEEQPEMLRSVSMGSGSPGASRNTTVGRMRRTLLSAPSSPAAGRNITTSNTSLLPPPSSDIYTIDNPNPTPTLTTGAAGAIGDGGLSEAEKGQKYDLLFLQIDNYIDTFESLKTSLSRYVHGINDCLEVERVYGKNLLKLLAKQGCVVY